MDDSGLPERAETGDPFASRGIVSGTSVVTPEATEDPSGASNAGGVRDVPR
jgi:hypothetical protein